jgi:hypothetical protein
VVCSAAIPMPMPVPSLFLSLCPACSCPCLPLLHGAWEHCWDRCWGQCWRMLGVRVGASRVGIGVERLG